ncbi:outer membrane beta-barrel protein [Hymenobacter sp. GOD-10R]|uniref:outer membrane beta-barrel protein n=1 Tax=Hymenobacter sp. GOD-10R TaxID=3093922 RepID=UPI002D7698E0|nr:outer membrane beta-barrel protein [Hymenobacter sp. GOD-10R]WRQ29731.1 outer membrane beta-barrel protein [Hymenobacter sp. GOD-10R]
MQKTFITTTAALFLLGLASTAQSQQLQALGVSGSFNIARLHSGQSAYKLGAVTIDPQFDQSNDETGNGITLFGRWQVGRGGWYAQPEVGYVSTLATPIGIAYDRGSFSYASQQIRHLDARLLAGYQAGPLRLFAGPSLGYHLRNTDRYQDTNPDVQAVVDALAEPPARVQAALQAGTGVSIWRLDINARYEWGLTQYRRTIQFQQQQHYLHQNLQQIILEVGYRFYRAPALAD